jgi:seryl-tRNA synthetase
MEMEVFNTEQQSWPEHQFLIAVEEYIMNSLKIPYRVLRKCTFDIGRPNASGVDIEAWMPGQADGKGAFRETHTADFIGDFQTRAMKTRVRRTDGTVELANTNDATASSERPLIAIIENFQTADGDVVVPEVLRPFMGGKERI